MGYELAASSNSALGGEFEPRLYEDGSLFFEEGAQAQAPSCHNDLSAESPLTVQNSTPPAISMPVRFRRGCQPSDGLKLSLDRKVSPRGKQIPDGRWVPEVPNSFGLPAGDSCPGKTPFCESCYAVGSEQSAGVRELVDHNLHMLTEAGSVEAMSELLMNMLAIYSAEADRYSLSDSERIFRIHWDGDFFSEDYALAWKIAMTAYPETKFFAYTRSFVAPVNVVPILSGIDHLSLYLSADEWNYNAASELIENFPDVKLARCAVDYRDARQLVPGRSSLVCPENAGRMPLMDEGAGACVKCQLCIGGSRDVLFSTSHREFIPRQLTLGFGSMAVAGIVSSSRS